VVDLSELDCKIYVEAEQTPDELATLLAQSLPEATLIDAVTRIVQTRFGEVEIRRNKEADRIRAQEFPDGFLYFRYALELYPFPTVAHEERVSLAASILKLLWSRGWPAVAACDYEDELPNGGGYHNNSVPWPCRRGDPVEAVPSAGNGEKMP
jgi:hypothetical protein